MGEEDFFKLLSNPILLKEFKDFLRKKKKIPQGFKPNKQLIEYFFEKKGYVHKVKKNYSVIFRFFIRFLKENIENKKWNLQEITDAEIDFLKTYLEKTDKLAKSTKEFYYKVLREFFEFFEKHSRRMKNCYFKEFPVFEKLRLDDMEIDVEILENKRIYVFENPWDVKIYLNGIMRLNFQFYLMERLQYESGLRFIDVKRILKRRLRLDKRYLFTQGRRGFRQYFLSQELVDDIKRFLEVDNGSEYLFNSSWGNPYSYGGYCYVLKRILKQLGYVINLTTRSGRKTFSTIRRKYLKQSKSEISMLLGHHIKNVTDLYIDYDVKDFLAIFDKYNYLKFIYLPDILIKNYLNIRRKMDRQYKVPIFKNYEELYDFFNKK